MKTGIDVLIAKTYHDHFGKMIGYLMHHTSIRDLGTAEDLVHDAFAAASAKWPIQLPDLPVAWLYQTLRNIAYNHIRNNKSHLIESLPDITAETESGDETYLLKLLLHCIHPSIAPKIQLIIALRYVNGLQVKRIASLLATNEDGISKILYRWREQHKNFNWNPSDEMFLKNNTKVEMLLKTLYMMFTAGYELSDKGELTNKSLCEDAISLLQQLIERNVSFNGQVKALYALMLYHIARSATRVSALNELVTLQEQDRTSWDSQMILVADRYLYQSKKESTTASVYQLEAVIAYLHTAAIDFKHTDWKQITGIYSKLVVLNPSPFTKLNQATALYFTKEISSAQHILDGLITNRFFHQYHLLHCLQARIHQDQGDSKKAIISYQTALKCRLTVLEAKFITKQLALLA